MAIYSPKAFHVCLHFSISSGANTHCPAHSRQGLNLLNTCTFSPFYLYIIGKWTVQDVRKPCSFLRPTYVCPTAQARKPPGPRTWALQPALVGRSFIWFISPKSIWQTRIFYWHLPDFIHEFRRTSIGVSCAALVGPTVALPSCVLR